MKLYDSGERLTEESLRRLEKALGLQLPSDYKDFMIDTNGGTPEVDLCFDFVDVVTGKTDSSDVREFLVFYEDEGDEDYNIDSILGAYRSMVGEECIPPHFLPIGDDSFGNVICMDLSKDGYGSIWFCDHELAEADTGFLAASRVASSFTEFLNRLYSYSDAWAYMIDMDFGNPVGPESKDVLDEVEAAL